MDRPYSYLLFLCGLIKVVFSMSATVNIIASRKTAVPLQNNYYSMISKYTVRQHISYARDVRNVISLPQGMRLHKGQLNSVIIMHFTQNYLEAPIPENS